MSASTLRSPTGAPVAPGELTARPLSLDRRQLQMLGELARRRGRVVERDGLSLHALGEAAILELPEGLGAKDAARAAGALLGGLGREGGARPLAIGALPFLPSRPGQLVIPRLSIRHEGGALEALAVTAPGDGASPEELIDELAGGRRRRATPPERFRLAPVGTHAAFRRRVEEALVEIAAGRLDKVVLAREVRVHGDREFRPEHLVGRLRQLHPSCLTFSVDGIVGASPELLVRLAAGTVTSQPLAGTVGRSGDPEQDGQLAAALLASAKERAEHDYVVSAIRDALAPFTRELLVPETPHLLELRNVVHLATAISGRLGGETSCLELVAAVHPTPAVCGTPREAALNLLGRSEELDRDRYAGPVGFCDSEGDGEFWLAIRSAMIAGREARLLAGVGIVEGSDPDSELAETQLKLQALLAAAVRP